ncbi:Villin-1 [Glycine max]|nr:Villin-1 [Glycine max]
MQAIQVDQVKEIYNYTQGDLITEDVLLLDCQREIYVWVGLHSTVKSKQEALNLGLKFLEMDVLVEGLSLNIPTYIVIEGHEPPFSLVSFHGITQKKISQLFIGRVVEHYRDLRPSLAPTFPKEDSPYISRCSSCQ